MDLNNKIKEVWDEANAVGIRKTTKNTGDYDKKHESLKSKSGMTRNCFLKLPLGAGEMAQWLGIHSAPADDPSSNLRSSTHIKQLITTYNYSANDGMPSSGGTP